MAAKQRNGSADRKGGISNTGATKRAKGSAGVMHSSEGFWKKHAVPVLILMTMAFILYAMSLKYGYVLDDEMVIWNNEFTQKGFGGLYDIFAFDSFKGYNKDQTNLLEGGRYRPLSVATFAIEIGLFGKDHPGIGHFINILLYGLTAVLLYRLLLIFFPSQKTTGWYFEIPFLASLLYLCHPLHVEVVANIKGRDEILALLGCLFALYASFKYFETAKKYWLWSSGIFLFLAMLSKENAITFLAVIPLSLYMVMKIPGQKILTASVPLFAAFLAFLFFRYQALGYVFSAGNEITDLINNPFLNMQTGEKYATIFLTLIWYIKLLLLPHPLTADYYPYHVPISTWSDWKVIGSLLLYLGMSLWAILNIKTRKWPAYFILFFLVTLSIVSNLFISVGTFMNERFLYMPSVSFCIAVGWMISQLLSRKSNGSLNGKYIAGVVSLCIIVSGYIWRTVTRVPDWENSLKLNTRSVEVSPNSARANLFYATSLYEDRYQKTTDLAVKAPLLDTLEYHIHKALKIHPTYGTAWMMRSALALARLEFDKDQVKMFAVLDSVMVAIPYHPDFRSLIDRYLRFLTVNGGDSELILSYCYRNGYERFYKEKNDLTSAIQILECGLETKTEDLRILDALAEVYGKAGLPAKAAEMQQRGNVRRNQATLK